ncbi:TetR/AcrR family transcriptional regulator [Neoroseomonas soli]|uniref:TetR family transcriptional regulator n=1 Tax=Neoroseomonas soli TaxID=1081025 RepID=A0A9X9WVP7_9PROT|nr:TetR family transcriptional regulator [Neoroseomonas soli]MBR0671226.1 TetR family transcriptional regulator [Neoroseomonas soli]
MARPYTLKRRAERQAETRQRIVEAAVELHGSIGPAQTTITMVAERAQVQRHTLYAHFPDERSLHRACSGLALERDPLPDPQAWHAGAKPEARLRAGLAAIYGWYGRNAKLAGCVLRDAEHHALTRETVGLRLAPWMQAVHEILSEGLTQQQRAMLHLALGYFTWRGLVREAGLAEAEAVTAMVTAILGQP